VNDFSLAAFHADPDKYEQERVAQAKLNEAAPDLAEALHGALEALSELECKLTGESQQFAARHAGKIRAALAKAAL
jgi:hypothetical protein